MILSRRKLMYLHIDRWVCTWHIQTGQYARLGQQQRIRGFEALPGDWVASNKERLCTAMNAGTLLCTRNGEVGAVQCAKLRRP